MSKIEKKNSREGLFVEGDDVSMPFIRKNSKLNKYGMDIDEMKN